MKLGRLCLCVWVAGWLAIASASEEIVSPPAALQAVQEVKPSINVVTHAAVNAGALSCASRINQVSNFLTAGSQGTGAALYVPVVDPDRKMISVSFEIKNANMSPAYANACFAPNQANGCGAIYEAVAYWNMKCEAVAAKRFAGLSPIGTMHKEIAMLDGGPELKVFLMPAGSGCVSIKKEAVQ